MQAAVPRAGGQAAGGLKAEETAVLLGVRGDLISQINPVLFTAGAVWDTYGFMHELPRQRHP